MANAWILQPLPILSAAASSTAPGRDAAFVSNDHIGVVWKSGAVAAPTITVDMGADVAIDTALLMGCTDAAPGWQLTGRAANAAQGSSFPVGSFISDSQELLAGSAMLPSGRAVGLWAPAAIPAASRYLRFSIVQGGTTPVTIGRIALGKRIELERNFSFGATLGIRDQGKADFSRFGVLLRSDGAKLRTVSLKFSATYKEEVEAAIMPLLAAIGNTGLIGLVIDPAPHEQRQRRIYYGILTGDLQAIWARPNGFEWSATLVSII